MKGRGGAYSESIRTCFSSDGAGAPGGRSTAAATPATATIASQFVFMVVASGGEIRAAKPELRRARLDCVIPAPPKPRPAAPLYGFV